MTMRWKYGAGFSLLEVIIATAALAGSAMVLISLIGMGTRFGSKAEQRSVALSVAQTVLDEYLIDTPDSDSGSEITGTIEGRWPMSYRLSLDSLTATGSSSDGIKVPGLVRITVEIFESEQAMNANSGASICRLSRWSQQKREAASSGYNSISSNLRPGRSP